MGSVGASYGNPSNLKGYLIICILFYIHFFIFQMGLALTHVLHTHTQDFFLKSDNFASQLNSKIGGPFTMLHTIIFKTKLV